MAEGAGEASEGSRHTQQPGVTPADLGGEVEHASTEEITLTSFEDVATPATAADDSTPTVNADLVDDPDELARTIEEASGAPVEIISESEQDPEA